MARLGLIYKAVHNRAEIIILSHVKHTATLNFHPPKFIPGQGQLTIVTLYHLMF